MGETAVEAVKREVKEEVGLNIEVGQMLLMQEAIFAPEFYKRRHFIFIDFACRSKNEKLKLDQDELQDYVWVYPGAAYNMKLDSFTKKTIDKFMEKGLGLSS